MSEKAKRYYQEYLEKGFSIEDSKDLAEDKAKKEEENKNKPKFFHEFWENEDELWEISLKESFRQRDERYKRLKERKNDAI